MKSKLGLWVMLTFLFASVWARAETVPVHIVDNGRPTMKYKISAPGKGKWICRFKLETNIAVEVPKAERIVGKVVLNLRADVSDEKRGYVELFQKNIEANSARQAAVKQGWMDSVWLEDYRAKVYVSLLNDKGQPEYSDASQATCEKIKPLEEKPTVRGRIGGEASGKIGAQ